MATSNHSPSPWRRAADILLPLAVVALMIGFWQLAARWQPLLEFFNLKPFLVPAPTEIATALWTDRGLLAENAATTAVEVVLGLAIALAAGFLLSVLLHLSPIAKRAIYPLLVSSQTIPIIAIAPILVVWFGFGIGPKLAIIALICFFPVTVNTLDGLRSVDPAQIRMMRTLDAGRLTILRRVEIPSTMPYVFSGARIACVVAVIGAVFGEWSGAESGLGHLILVAQGQLQTARVFAAMVVLSLIALTLFTALTLIERRFAWWGTDADRRQ